MKVEEREIPVDITSRSKVKYNNKKYGKKYKFQYEQKYENFEREIPVDIKSRGRVKSKLLLAASCCCVPDYCRPDFTEDEMQQEIRKEI